VTSDSAVNPIEFIPTRAAIRLSAPAGFELASSAIGFGGDLIRLWIQAEAADAVFARTENPGFASFPVTQSAREYTAKITITNEHIETDFELQGVSISYPLIQTLPGDRVILVGARCTRFPDGSAELNARVYRFDGSFDAQFCLGDGIEHFQVDKQGQLWVGYSDEGVYGNFGWGGYGGDKVPQDIPIGAFGLVCFDSTGKKLWEYRAPNGFDPISDCYSLNVADDKVWLCYYTGFPIARIDSDRSIAAWPSDLSGPTQLAVSGNAVLAFGGYEGHRTDCSLVKLEEGSASSQTLVKLVLPHGVDLAKCTVLGRGPLLHVLSDHEWFSFCIPS
jgi:hypothetical protein